LRTLFSFFG